MKRHSHKPEYNEEVAVPFRFPSMCETLQLQLVDWNRVRMDNVIGNNLLSLSEISSLGNKGKSFMEVINLIGKKEVGRK